MPANRVMPVHNAFSMTSGSSVGKRCYSPLSWRTAPHFSITGIAVVNRSDEQSIGLRVTKSRQIELSNDLTSIATLLDQTSHFWRRIRHFSRKAPKSDRLLASSPESPSAWTQLFLTMHTAVSSAATAAAGPRVSHEMRPALAFFGSRLLPRFARRRHAESVHCTTPGRHHARTCVLRTLRRAAVAALILNPIGCDML